MQKNRIKNILVCVSILQCLCACAILSHKYEHMGIVDGAEEHAEFLQSSDLPLYQSVSGSWVLGKAGSPLFENKYKILDTNRSATVFLLLIESQKDSDLYIFDSVTHLIRSVPVPAAATRYKQAALSPDAKQVAAVTQRLNIDGKDANDDRIYFIEVDTLKVKEMAARKKQTTIGSLAWNKLGTNLYYQELYFFGYTIIKRALSDSSPTVIFDTFLGPFWIEHVPEALYSSPIEVRRKCGDTIVAVANGAEGRTQQKSIFLEKEKNKLETIVKISDRERACTDCEGFVDLAPQFSSDCKDIFFNIGDAIMVYDCSAKRVGKYAAGRQLHLLSSQR